VKVGDNWVGLTRPKRPQTEAWRVEAGYDSWGRGNEPLGSLGELPCKLHQRSPESGDRSPYRPASASELQKRNDILVIKASIEYDCSPYSIRSVTRLLLVDRYMCRITYYVYASDERMSSVKNFLKLVIISHFSRHMQIWPCAGWVRPTGSSVIRMYRHNTLRLLGFAYRWATVHVCSCTDMTGNTILTIEV